MIFQQEVTDHMKAHVTLRPNTRTKITTCQLWIESDPPNQQYHKMQFAIIANMLRIHVNYTQSESTNVTFNIKPGGLAHLLETLNTLSKNRKNGVFESLSIDTDELIDTLKLAKTIGAIQEKQYEFYLKNIESEFSIPKQQAYAKQTQDTQLACRVARRLTQLGHNRNATHWLLNAKTFARGKKASMSDRAMVERALAGSQVIDISACFNSEATWLLNELAKLPYREIRCFRGNQPAEASINQHFITFAKQARYVKAIDASVPDKAPHTIKSEAQVSLLAVAIAAAKNVSKLNLAGNPIGDIGLQILLPALKSIQIKRLDLQHCNISDQGAQLMADYWKAQPILSHLHMNDQTFKRADELNRYLFNRKQRLAGTVFQPQSQPQGPRQTTGSFQRNCAIM